MMKYGTINFFSYFISQNPEFLPNQQDIAWSDTDKK